MVSVHPLPNVGFDLKKKKKKGINCNLEFGAENEKHDQTFVRKLQVSRQGDRDQFQFATTEMSVVFERGR